MKTLLSSIALLVCSIGAAEPGMFVGSGEVGIPGEAKKSYTVNFDVKELVSKKKFQVTETYQMENESPKTFVNVYEFKDDGTMAITRDNVNIGCGYCIKQSNGNKWCDFHIQTEEGRLHVNQYYDAKEKKLHRIGDIIKLDGVHVWTDTVTLEEPEESEE